MPDANRRRQTDGARILVVEDSDDLRLLMKFTLESEGYAVDGAASAEDGLRLLRDQHYALLLTDFALPGNSGMWLLHEARALLDRTATLLVTGDPDAPAIDDDVPVVRKPLDFEAFLPQIRTLLSETLRSTAPPPERAAAVDLVLYVSPDSPPCARALRIVRELLSRYDAGLVNCTICDVTKEPEMAAAARVSFTPALVKRSPPPAVWILGALTKPERIDDLLRTCGVSAGGRS